MADKKVVELLVNGGQANAGPPLGPALGPLGLNVMAVVTKINELTKDYAGMKVPVKITAFNKYLCKVNVRFLSKSLNFQKVFIPFLQAFSDLPEYNRNLFRVCRVLFQA